MEPIPTNFKTTAPPFSARWFDALSDGAAEKNPWIVQSFKTVWRLYYRAPTKKDANELATNLRNAGGKMPHKHAIRVIHQDTGEAGISFSALRPEIKDDKSKKSDKAA